MGNKLFEWNITTRRKRKFRKKGLVARMLRLQELKPNDDILVELRFNIQLGLNLEADKEER